MCLATSLGSCRNSEMAVLDLWTQRHNNSRHDTEDRQKSELSFIHFQDNASIALSIFSLRRFPHCISALGSQRVDLR